MNIETIVFGGGCFWCTEAVFEELKGVVSVLPGYSGGATKNPTYESIHSGKPTSDEQAGHAEVIKVEFDPAIIAFRDLLTVFFAMHDPTTLNRQGADVGSEYRSAVFYTAEQQKLETEKFIEELSQSGPKVVTEVKPLDVFYPAEESNRQFYKNNTESPYCQVVINPKMEKLKKRFNELLK
jgi:peptide-methionine (S)-S-oxide reductase